MSNRRPFSRRDLLRAGVALPALLLPAAAAGCSGEGRAAGAGAGAAGPTPQASPTSTSATTIPAAGTSEVPGTVSAPNGPRGPLGNGQSVTFAFAGDTHFVDHWDTEGGTSYAGVPVLADQLLADPTQVLAPIMPVLERADVAMLNLETAITDRGTPVPGKTYHFRSPPEAFLALRAAGVDVVNMANNHALDYGPVGMHDTFDAIARSGMPVVGIGKNADEAYAPYLAVVNGQRIAIFGTVDWLEPNLVSDWTATDSKPGLAFSIDPTRLVAGVAAVRPNVDTLIVFLHWGVEQTTCASPAQHSLAQALIAAGADILVGSHAHRVFGAGHTDGAFVAYGLGNFVYFREDGASGSSGVLLLRATGRRVDAYTWVPARIVHGIPHPETGTAAAADLSGWAQLRTCSGLAP